MWCFSWGLMNQEGEFQVEMKRAPHEPVGFLLGMNGNMLSEQHAREGTPSQSAKGAEEIGDIHPCHGYR
jgi:hypothetical protein